MEHKEETQTRYVFGTYWDKSKNLSLYHVHQSACSATLLLARLFESEEEIRKYIKRTKVRCDFILPVEVTIKPLKEQPEHV